MILGKGPERERLEAEVRRLGLEGRVDMPGYAAEPWDAYAKAKCFVLSSQSEQFGNVIVEALAYGLPVVSTAAVGPKEILDGGKFGRLVPIGDDAALAAAINDALDDPGDPAKRRARADTVLARRPRTGLRGADRRSDGPGHQRSGPASISISRTSAATSRASSGVDRTVRKTIFRGADLRPVRSNGVLSMIWRQQVLLPLLALVASARTVRVSGLSRPRLYSSSRGGARSSTCTIYF